MKTIKLSVLLTAIVTMASLASCKKCMECHYEKNGQDLELGEYCGDDIEELEKNGYTDADGTHPVHCGGH